MFLADKIIFLVIQVVFKALLMSCTLSEILAVELGKLMGTAKSADKDDGIVRDSQCETCKMVSVNPKMAIANAKHVKW